jgi:putative membrane protein insertion efficiency factor
VKQLLLRLIRWYRSGISPLTPPSCRFTPTCSRYALDAVEKYGAWKGGWLALRRIVKCHPFHKGGYDPVP